ncbi:MAG: CaiB/BaiF CoA transferase family protein [Alphaproteobacteria bacterium]
MSRAPLPLEGIRVVDFTQVYMGPCATQALADYGADVIKIEPPKVGDRMRWAIPGDPAGEQGPIFCSINRNKRSVVLDMRTEPAKEAVRRMIATADVVANNFRAGVMERLGFGYEACAALNPRLVYAVGTGYGLEGPYVDKGGQDALAQAMTGAIWRRASPEIRMGVPATTFADYCAGMHLAQGILLALMQRQQTGRGQLVSVSLHDSMIAAQMQEVAVQLMRQRALNWASLPTNDVFETSDGAFVMIGGFSRQPMKDIGAVIGMPGLEADPRFATHELRVENREALHGLMRARFAEGTTAHWIERLEAQDLLCAPVRPLSAALEDPQVRINDMILEADAPWDRLRLAGSPVHLSDAPVRGIRRLPPRLGEHTDEILAELGLDGAQVAP